MRDTVSENALVEQFKAIAHPLRLRILEALCNNERNVGEIEHATGIGQPALSQQLGVLRKAGLVETRKEAKLVFYSLAADKLGALSGLLSALTPDTSCQQGQATKSAALAPASASGVANFARLS